MVAYAQAKGCNDAILVYLQPLRAPLDVWIGDVHVRTVSFSLANDLEQAGQAFLQNILGAPDS